MTRLYRKGNIVAVKAEVMRDQKIYEGPEVEPLEPTLAVKIEGQWSEFHVPLNAVQLSVAHFDVGDSVAHRAEKTAGTILAIHDDVLWIDTEDGFETWIAADVDLAPRKSEGGAA